MIILVNNKSTKFCQITIKRFIRKRQVVPFFLPHDVYDGLVLAMLITLTVSECVDLYSALSSKTNLLCAGCTSIQRTNTFCNTTIISL